MRRLMTVLLFLAGLSFVALPALRADDTKKSDESKKEQKKDGAKAEGKHGFLGIQLGGEAEDGKVTIQGVQPDGPAEKAGIKAGDVLLKIGKQEVKDVQAVVKTVGAAKPGDKLKLTIERDGKEKTITVTLAEKPMEDDE